MFYFVESDRPQHLAPIPLMPPQSTPQCLYGLSRVVVAPCVSRECVCVCVCVCVWRLSLLTDSRCLCVAACVPCVRRSRLLGAFLSFGCARCVVARLWVSWSERRLERIVVDDLTLRFGKRVASEMGGDDVVCNLESCQNHYVASSSPSASPKTARVSNPPTQPHHRRAACPT